MGIANKKKGTFPFFLQPSNLSSLAEPNRKQLAKQNHKFAKSQSIKWKTVRDDSLITNAKRLEGTK